MQTMWQILHYGGNDQKLYKSKAYLNRCDLYGYATSGVVHCMESHEIWHVNNIIGHLHALEMIITIDVTLAQYVCHAVVYIQSTMHRLFQNQAFIFFFT